MLLLANKYPIEAKNLDKLQQEALSCNTYKVIIIPDVILNTLLSSHKR